MTRLGVAKDAPRAFGMAGVAPGDIYGHLQLPPRRGGGGDKGGRLRGPRRFHLLPGGGEGGGVGAASSPKTAPPQPASRLAFFNGVDGKQMAEALAGAPGRPGQKSSGGNVGGEPLQIAALRERSNFLTLRAGIASSDTWAALALVARNLLLNWMVFLPALMAVALLFNLHRSAVAAPWPGYASMLFGSAPPGPCCSRARRSWPAACCRATPSRRCGRSRSSG